MRLCQVRLDLKTREDPQLSFIDETKAESLILDGGGDTVCLHSFSSSSSQSELIFSSLSILFSCYLCLIDDVGDLWGEVWQLDLTLNLSLVGYW